MRITNSMMNNNTKTNININKEYSDKLNTMISTGQKITRPSDDPIIAIRALRLNSNLTEANQYYTKNIPDAEAWMKTTETALSQTDSVLTGIMENLTTGASDDNTATDRKNILAGLSALRNQIYSAGNADYAGRTVFTGYRTGESLTFKEQSNTPYTIIETFDREAVETMTYIKGGFDAQQAIQDAALNPTEQSIDSKEIYRVRLAYDKLAGPGQQKDLTSDPAPTADNLAKKIVFYDKDGNAKVNGAGAAIEIKVTIQSLTGNPQTDDALYLGVPNDEAYLIAETGELILGKDAKALWEGAGPEDTMQIEYRKEEFAADDLRPEHYFSCISLNAQGKPIGYNYDKDEAAPADTTKWEPNFQNDTIEYEISFNQKIGINIHADSVFKHAIGRDVDELINVTQAVVDSDAKIAKIREMQEDPQYADDASKAKLKDMLSAAIKENDLLKEKMQQTFSEGLTRFKGYQQDTNFQLAEVGNMRSRLALTKERMSDQQTSFKTLADENININLSDTAIDLSNAKLSLEAAQLSASKIAQQTLLNYL